MQSNDHRAKFVGITALAVLPFALLVGLPERLARSLLSEDSVVEWAGALGWLAASAFFAATIVSRRRSGTLSVPPALWLVGLALMCFVAAGEEISWGQRLIGYDTPGAVARTNLQQEMNLHNHELLDVRRSADGEAKVGLARWLTFNRLSSLIWMGYLVATPLAVRFSSWVRTLATRWGPPIPPLGVALAASVNYVAFSVLTASLADPDGEQKLLDVGANEIKESVIAVLFAVTAYLYVRPTAPAKPMTAAGIPR